MTRWRDGVWWKQPVLNWGPPALRKAMISARDRAQALTPTALAKAGRRGDLPDIVIIGAQKAGTTSMFDELRRHPCVMTSIVKEAHYYDENFARGEAWYRALFPEAEPGTKIVEATPCYLSHPEVPARLKEVTPNARLVAMLREPVSRAYSQFQHESRLGFEREPFDVAIEAESTRLAGERDHLARDADYRSEPWSHATYVTRGRYAEQLERWHEHFDPEQIHVVISEDYFADPETGIADVLRFAGLDPDLQPEPDGGYKSFSYGTIEGETADQLRETFAPETKKLEEFLGRDLPSSWPR